MSWAQNGLALAPLPHEDTRFPGLTARTGSTSGQQTTALINLVVRPNRLQQDRFGSFMPHILENDPEAEQASSHDNISAINSSGVTGRAFPALNSS